MCSFDLHAAVSQLTDYFNFYLFVIFLGGGSRQGFSVALESVQELVDQAGLELTETRLPLSSECWD